MKEVERYRRECKKLKDLNYNINISLVLILIWNDSLLWPWVRNLHHYCHTKRSRKRKIKTKLAFSPKRAMAELRHSSSLGSRAGSSPMKRDDTASPLIHEQHADDDDDGRSRHLFRDRVRSIWSYFPFLSDDPRVSQQNSRISLCLALFVVVAGLISILSIVNHLVSYLVLFCFGIFFFFNFSGQCSKNLLLHVLKNLLWEFTDKIGVQRCRDM